MAKSSLKRVILLIVTVALAFAAWLFRLAPELRGQGADSAQLPSHIYPILSPSELDPAAIHFVAVGDSYTYCEGATEAQAWPTVLTRDLAAKAVSIQLAGNLGIDGITSQGVLNQEMPAYRSLRPTFATLLIGVNDSYRTVTVAQFRTNLSALVNQIQSALPNRSQLILITIPDMGASPVGARYATMNGAASKIVQYNEAVKKIGKKRHLPVVDIFPYTSKMRADPTLIAADHLHPSAKEYAIWERAILPVAYDMLKSSRN